MAKGDKKDKKKAKPKLDDKKKVKKAKPTKSVKPKSKKKAPAAAKSAGLPVSPLAPKSLPDLPQIAGVEFASAATGTKYKGRDDVMLAKMAAGTAVAGVFTRSATRAAPVLDCESKLGQPAGRKTAAFFVNAGNANAFTGSNGAQAVATIAKAVASATGVSQGRVFTASTGVIGEPLPADRIAAVLDDMSTALSPAGMAAAAGAIRTTDTFSKAATTQVEVDGETVNIAGIAKGSGMIAPDMATMLVYIFTDAKIAQAPLQRLVGRLTDTTFNAITVDGDTSTSDTLLVAATGKSAAPAIGDLRSRNAKLFADGLNTVMLDLAHQVVRDGEGATKFVEVAVTGAASDRDARKAAMAIANSPLVKTAIAGQDPNWGRVVMAVGKSGAKADRDTLSIWFGDVLVAENGWVSPDYTEADGAKYMQQETLKITVDLGVGDGTFTAWTCDFTHGYISINADYRS